MSKNLKSNNDVWVGGDISALGAPAKKKKKKSSIETSVVAKTEVKNNTVSEQRKPEKEVVVAPVVSKDEQKSLIKENEVPEISHFLKKSSDEQEVMVVKEVKTVEPASSLEIMDKVAKKLLQEEDVKSVTEMNASNDTKSVLLEIKGRRANSESAYKPEELIPKVAVAKEPKVSSLRKQLGHFSALTNLTTPDFLLSNAWNNATEKEKKNAYKVMTIVLFAILLVLGAMVLKSNTTEPAKKLVEPVPVSKVEDVKAVEATSTPVQKEPAKVEDKMENKKEVSSKK